MAGLSSSALFRAGARVAALALLAGPDPDGLRVAEFLDAVAAELATVAGGLDPAEGQLGIRGGGAVDEHHAGLEPLDELLLLAGVGGPDVGAQPVVGGVRQLQRLLDAAHAVELGDRAEH